MFSFPADWQVFECLSLGFVNISGDKDGKLNLLGTYCVGVGKSEIVQFIVDRRKCRFVLCLLDKLLDVLLLLVIYRLNYK